MENMIHTEATLKSALHKTIVTIHETEVSNMFINSWATLERYIINKNLNIQHYVTTLIANNVEHWPTALIQWIFTEVIKHQHRAALVKRALQQGLKKKKINKK